MKKRSEADVKDTWKLEDMVAEDGLWEQMFKEASGETNMLPTRGGWLTARIPFMPAFLSTTGFPRR